MSDARIGEHPLDVALGERNHVAEPSYIEMIGIIACIALGQATQTLSAEEIQRRLDAPITYQCEPTRLPVALDEIGSLVGIRIRCEPELQPAVVVVSMHGRPAKEVVKHLLDGIGAGSNIQAGTMHVGLRLMSEEQTAKQVELELRAIKSALESKAKALKIDEPIDPALAEKVAHHAMLALQSTPMEYRPPHASLYTASSQSPAMRATVAILNAIGPELLRVEDGRPKAIDMRSLTPEQAGKVAQILEKYQREQTAWALPFEPVFKLLPNAQYSPIPEDLLERSLPLGKAKPDDFRVSLQPHPWGRSVQTEIVAGGLTVSDISDYLPRQRTYTDPGGDYFSISKASQITVNLGEKVKWI